MSAAYKCDHCATLYQYPTRFKLDGTTYFVYASKWSDPKDIIDLCPNCLEILMARSDKDERLK